MKPLIVVFLIAGIVFYGTKRYAPQLSSPADFSRRRNIWLFLTSVAFLSSNFWVFAVFAIPLYIWGGLKDSNPLAFYLLLFPTIPSIPVATPILISIDNNWLLGVFVLIPAWIRRRRISRVESKRPFDTMDWAVIGFGVLQSLIFVVPDLPGHIVMTDSATNCMRRAFFFCIGSLIIYLVARDVRNRKEICDGMFSFCVGCLIMAIVATFESMRGWYLYSDIGGHWSDDTFYSFYLFRGSSLRAKAAANTTLELGYLLAVSLGFWLCISSEIKSIKTRWVIILLYSLGLLATYSRGPWIGSFTVAFLYIWIRRASLPKLIRLLLISLVAVLAISLTPIGTKIASVFPALGGDVDAGNIAYRERLFERCIDLIKGSPFFGDQWAYFKMEDLRQGQGIIDFVNAYAEEAVFYGIVGLILLMSPMFIGLVRSYRTARKHSLDDKLADVGYCIVACIAGTLLMLSGTSFMGDYVILFYVLAGFASAYSVRLKSIGWVKTA